MNPYTSRYGATLIVLVLLYSIPTIGQEQKLFTLLEPAHTGVNFENTVQDTKESNILIYSNFYGGAGVGVGDFNRDGLADIFFAGNQVDDRLYINKGTLRFEDKTQEAGIENNGGWSSGVVVGDINRDGWLDIYVSRELYDGAPELRRNKLYINTSKDSPNGETSFREMGTAYGLDNTERTRHATFLDYNKDGFLDVFLLNQPPNPGNYSVMYDVDRNQDRFAPKLYKNNGNNTFSEVTQQAGLLQTGNANSVSIFDANNDGWQDIYLTNDYGAPDALYLNNGNGTFKNTVHQSMRHISYFSMGVDAADINNDGKLDLMVLDMVAEDNYRLKSNMSGMNPQSFWNIVKAGGHYQYMFNTLQLNQGNYDGIPRFGDIAQMGGVSNTDWSWSNVIADFDNDGYKDIYVTNGLLRDIRNTDSDKKVGDYITKTANDFVANNPNRGDVPIWDILDLNETLNLIPSVKLANYAYKNQNGMVFKNISEDWGLAQKTFSAGCAYADFDNDGDLDLVVNNVNDPASIYRNNSENKPDQNYLRIGLTDKVSHSPMIGARAEIFHGETKQLYEFTSVRGMYSTSEPIAHFGLAERKKIDSLKITWPNGQYSIYTDIAPNVNMDIDYNKAPKKNPSNHTPKQQQLPLFTEIDPFGLHHVENRFDDYAKQVLLPHKQSQFGPAMAIGDVNGDGLEDLYMGGAAGVKPVLLVQDRSGRFTRIENSLWDTQKIYEDIDAAFFDADNDGDNDLYVVSGGNEWPEDSNHYQDRLYVNNGKGNFTLAHNRLPEITESGAVVRPFDYDKDGDMDLFVGGRHTPWNYPEPTTSRILNNDNGKFKDVTKSIAKELLDIGMVTDAHWIDFDSDGLIDLAITGEWMPLTFFKNTGSTFENATRKTGIKNSEGWWYSIDSADFDHDGDLDLIVGNLGLNYKYKASLSSPFEVYFDDFDQNGDKDIVLSYYNFGEQFPLRGKSCSSQQIPTISKKFPSYEIFASASLQEVYGEDKLQNSLHYKAKTFTSAYLENLGGGHFSMRPLPHEAQISNIDAILIADFDQDGNKDILIGGNLYPVEIETTRNDAGIGLLLLGNGVGDFSPIPLETSGFCIDGDIQQLSFLNANGAKVVIAATNNGKVRCFKVNGLANKAEQP